ncbi:dihydroorotate dehydrogenase electron transfer subunit [Microaerobacter geothermalis]|uniref:dihydroorotate dehydrogenase electron transfer subunit n=1 Tax=Microaerobacter geothermalis TaxID=674972 RepID=UPI001F3B1301|nr:dihydroorotate dehydrogenase electron transfer subunit [Microaerobacter geothermalis]MCF6094766.1 dihydroorotate dehydrogenase electron transfer subunit [Microaerobacter geothermalis]
MGKSRKGILTIVHKEEIAEGIIRVELVGELVKEMDEPGQFIHIRPGMGIDPFLRRPISICDVNLEENKLTIIFRVEGKGTQLLAETPVGTEVDVLGPLGQGFPIHHRQSGDHALLVGGGVGVPPLLYLAKKLVRQGVKVTSIIGFGEKNQVFLEDELAFLGTVYVTTIDGSYGYQGLVTDLFPQVKKWNVLYSCGPIPMLKAIQHLFKEEEKEGYLSLEQRMGCGVGACLACVCQVNSSEKKYKKICSDGPVFALEEVAL